MENIIKFINSSKKEVILFGASNYGVTVLKKLKESGVNVICFCDNLESKWGTDLCGLKIISKNELYNIDKEIPIIITTIYHEAIKKQLEIKGFENVYYFDHISYYFLKHYDLEYIKDNFNLISSVEKNLSDHKSVQVMNSIIKHRFTGDFSYLTSIKDDYYSQYFDHNIIELTENEIFIDGGAYRGETTEFFVNLVLGKYKKVYVYEPDKHNYEKLMERFTYKDYHNIIIKNKGLYNSSEKLSFSCKGSSSKISNKGEISIEVEELDKILEVEKQPVTFIKLDIEGSELKAILGARNIITKFKPKLAISVYHKPEDLWEIPLLIKKLVPEYKIYLRHYRNYLGETVCYAII